MAFISCQQGSLKDVYITEYDIVDRYVGSRLWIWGSNDTGELGNNNTIYRSSPVQTVSTGLNWQKTDTTIPVAAIKSDGTLWMWGLNTAGYLGNNTTIDRSSPVQTVSTGTNWCDFFVGPNGQTSSIKTDGTLWIWGGGFYGQLGNNNTIDLSSPVQTVSTGTNWKKIIGGSAAIKADGTLWLWGLNGNGQLGNNNTIDRSSPVQTVTQGTNWKTGSSVANIRTYAIKSDGTLWGWGGNFAGNLGNNNDIERSSPVQTISQGTNWKQVSAGQTNTAAIKTDGTLWIWGCNVNGQLGNNDTIDRSSPIQTVTTGTNWKQVSAGSSISSAIKTDGTLWLWGGNNTGGLGNNNTIDQSSPVQTVTTGTYWKQVSSKTGVVSAVTYTE